MNKQEFHKVVSGALSVKLYPDFSPKSDEFSTSYTHISNNTDRVADGSGKGKTDNWRVTISGKERIDCDNIINEILLLDNQSSDMFQAVYILSVNDEPADTNSKSYRAFVDIKTFDK